MLDNLEWDQETTATIETCIDRFYYGLSVDPGFYERKRRILVIELLCLFVTQKFTDHIPDDF